MHGWVTRMRLKNYLNDGILPMCRDGSGSLGARSMAWTEAGQRDRDRATGKTVGATTVDEARWYRYQGVVRDRLAESPKVSARRLMEELWEGGYLGCCTRVRLRGQGATARFGPVARFEAPPGAWARWTPIFTLRHRAASRLRRAGVPSPLKRLGLNRGYVVKPLVGQTRRRVPHIQH